MCDLSLSLSLSLVPWQYNHYRDATNWKPFHFDSAALNKDAGKGKGGKGGGKGGGRPHMCESQNMTVGVSFGEVRLP